MRVADAARYLGMSPSGVRAAARAGRLPHTVSASGQRIFDRAELDTYMGKRTSTEPLKRVEALYVRVSGSTGQEASLVNQEQTLRDTSRGVIYRVYKDTASGLRENRSGLSRLLDDAAEKRFTVVRVVWKDRLARFGVSYIERYLNQLGVTIEVVNEKSSKSLTEELMDDFMALLASFSGRFYQLRSKDNQRCLLDVARDRLS
jgi:predicted site-specific integrase-resolvase